MDEIKSAREIAQEKIEKLGEATEEERLEWKYLPQGEQLAAKYLKEDCSLVTELNRYQEKERKYVIKGIAIVLSRNLGLPKNDFAKKTNKKVMDGLKTLKHDKVELENIYSQIRYLFDHYAGQGEQQRKQAYQALKTELQAKMQQAVQQQMGTLTPVAIDIEKQPQFQQEWRKLQNQMDSQYLSHLDEYKRELSETD